MDDSNRARWLLEELLRRADTREQALYALEGVYAMATQEHPAIIAKIGPDEGHTPLVMGAR